MAGGRRGKQEAHMQAVENILAELYQLSTEPNENAYVDPTVLVQDLQRAIEAEVNEEQLGYYFLINPLHNIFCLNKYY